MAFAAVLGGRLIPTARAFVRPVYPVTKYRRCRKALRPPPFRRECHATSPAARARSSANRSARPSARARDVFYPLDAVVELLPASPRQEQNRRQRHQKRDGGH